ncbi:MAG: hypothetical protein ACKO4Z_15525 [Planctomycetota bacterium]
MLYRLSYSLARYPTEARDAGNANLEGPAMHADEPGPGPARLMLALAVVLAAPPLAAGQSGGSPAGADRNAASRQPVIVPQDDDGTILLSGSHAVVRGTMLRWEPQPHKLTLGYWTQAEDAAEWTFAVNAPGDFEVEVLQGCGTGQGGSEMAVALDPGRIAATLRFVVEDTGGFQQFRPRTVGRITIADAGTHVLRIKPERIAKHAACDIRQVRLVPVAPESAKPGASPP